MSTLTRTLTYGAAALVIGGAVYLAFREQPILVDIVAVDAAPMEVTVNEEGITRVRDVFEISAPITGQLERIDLEEGDRIKANETVVAHIQPITPPFLDNRTAQELSASIEAAHSAVRLAEVNYARAQADLVLAETELKRGLELQLRDVVSQAELDKRRNLAELRRIEVESAEVAISLRKAELRSMQARQIQPTETGALAPDGACCIAIMAPVDGVVLHISEKSQKVVSAGEVIVEAGDPSKLEIAVDLLSSDAVKINVGSRVVISDWGGDEALHAVVRRIDPAGFMKVSALGIEEQRVNAVLDLDEVPSALGHGYRVFANFVIWSSDDALQVPVGALFRSEGDWVVFTVDDNRASLRRIEIGQMNESHAQIISGLENGDRVVLYPNDELEDGGLVETR